MAEHAGLIPIGQAARLLMISEERIRQLVKQGFVYIAQPPLYKAARGRSEVYLKDDAALDDYLVEAGIGAVALETNGAMRSGADLKLLIDHARRTRSLMRYVPRKYDPAIVEGLALVGARRFGTARKPVRAECDARWRDDPSQPGTVVVSRCDDGALSVREKSPERA